VLRFKHATVRIEHSALTLFLRHLSRTVSYSGWNAASYVTEEIEHPKRTLPRALVLGTTVVGLFYITINAILLQAAVSTLMVLTGTFEGLVYYIGFALIFFSGLAVAGVSRMRQRPKWQRLRAVSWCYPLVPLTFVLASAWMLIWTLAARPKESVLGLLTTVCGWLVYRVMRGHNAVTLAARDYPQ
jgi:amino acid transporter